MALDTEYQWSAEDRTRLNDLIALNKSSVPEDAPRCLLSVRLSVFTDDTTSPARQEMDLWRAATDKGYRVVGVASDLGVSATEKAPWERPSLGEWLNNRSPEFDVLLFWKLDRFVRSISDMNVMIRWAQEFQKNLVSLNDPIDLDSPIGQVMVTFISAMAQIESANTRIRVASMWQYTKSQDEWITGRPPFGYKVIRDDQGKKRLGFEEDEYAILRAAFEWLIDDPNVSAREVAMTFGMDATNLRKRLKSPANLGVRVETEYDSRGKKVGPRVLLDTEGLPIVVGPPIFTEDEMSQIEFALRQRSQDTSNRPVRVSEFIDVIECADCHKPMRIQRQVKSVGREDKEGNVRTEPYMYLRCEGCKGGGPGLNDPQAIYDRIVMEVLYVVGEYEVEEREYARGEDTRKRIKKLEDTIAYYMTGLEPGGNYAATEFTRKRAEQTLNSLIAELSSIDPADAEDRWKYRKTGMSFRERWQDGGTASVHEDMARAGIRCQISRTKVKGKRAVDVKIKVLVPPDVKKRLVVKPNDFRNAL